MDTTPSAFTTPEPQEPIELAAAFAELQNLVLDGPDVTAFLQELSALAAAIVPGTHCGITLRRDGQIATVVSSDEVAMRMDEVQYMRGRGPCLAAIHEGIRVEVRDMETETRWGDYAGHAVANGIHSVCSVPLILDGKTWGALNLFAATPHAFTDHDITRAEAFTAQAATALTILLRHASHTVLDDQLGEALATRALIDQALGILMVTRKISAHEAFEILRHSSQTSNRKVSTIAAELIESLTGHPPEPPRPLAQRS
ncbi:GAF and ANTAR domain-containing protein [Nocardioides islandensis]|uniref:GAF and ANTAR domain-containing protein n=1 Tax=Nocardioides islandensis TaxID=433663 RepID=A0A930V9D0_9ACTN|nr:GAF and ANTAR domain-containing protein [Nocardioides islandensis]MBF4762303.1 GAF and ANTAR domain-containing protein [Nocardioides islandensis]